MTDRGYDTQQANTGRTNRIPPPPLLDRELEQENRQHTSTDNTSIDTPSSWILRVRCSVRPGESAIVKVQVLRDMTSNELGQCLLQAISSLAPAPSDSIVVRSPAKYNLI